MVKYRFVRWVSFAKLGLTRVFGGVVLSVGVLFATSFIAVTPAHADVCCGAAKVCPQNYFCVWEKPSYSGKWVRQIGNGDSVNRPNVGAYLNDQISSLWNRTGGNVCVYQDADYRGAWRTIFAGDSHHDLRNDYFNNIDHDTSPINDRISSWKAC